MDISISSGVGAIVFCIVSFVGITFCILWFMKFAFGRGYIHIFAFRRCPQKDCWTQTIVDIFATSLVFGIQQFATVVSGFYPPFLDTPINGFGYGSGLTAGLLFKLIVRN